ncbi:riboflavin synthase alpha chain [Parasphingorhabdus marina DSM 22363]|uniref:Riboflavin synthase n=1 Tax=Parasphingorhabdus marina DSM 22363 TaxID=1123272 RepID=A0A1N6CQF1_9SPHN|nr:riboflavin synthase [Parasphingorhabdus marina]SIN60665.1 riboflavin synthase alpha chain [Parasphingorhabdus marina DSM 22363]
MFTGIVTDIGRISAVEERGDLRVKIACGYDMGSVDIGASIACSGACLTVVDKGDDWFAVDISAESISKTATGMWTEGRRLNLERALKVGDELGGHIVTGHVDAVGTVVGIESEGDSRPVRIQAPQSIAAYLAAKGSVTVDGVSLTVNTVEDQADGSTIFGLNIIPHTAKVTTFADLETGSEVNLEIDILARYLSRMEKVRSAA